jgi:hypothetical protein
VSSFGSQPRKKLKKKDFQYIFAAAAVAAADPAQR